MSTKKSSFATLSNEALCKIRDEIAELLTARAEALRQELNQLTGSAMIIDSEARGKKNIRNTRGKKLVPKYRGPDGNTWCGRGLRPRWLMNEMKEGKKLEDFLILPHDKASRNTNKNNLNG